MHCQSFRFHLRNLTVSEVFPLETRAMAIAFFYMVGTGAGGIVAPWLFGTLIGTGSRKAVFYGYLDGAILMLAAAVVEVLYGVRAGDEVARESRRTSVFRSLSRLSEHAR